MYPRKDALVAARIARGATTCRPNADNAALPRFCMSELAGRLVELSGQGAASCVLTLAVGLLLDAQREREPAAWVCETSSSFYPPDLANSGVDLAGLCVVRVGSAEPIVRAGGQKRADKLAVCAERVIRSGAFGLVVIDLGKDAVLSQPLQSRLLGLAQRHQSVLLCLTEKAPSVPSLGSLVSLRAHAARIWIDRDRFACQLEVLKDKRRGPTWSQSEVCRGPLGLH